MLETPATKASSCDARLIAVLDSSTESIERELAALPIFDQRTLHARLANPRRGDLLAARFSALLCERRDRVLAFLADTRRRACLR
jgi:hypothetical protein